ncbi:MAG TPA: cyclic nucleotide-binding domain-containing protein [Candidatus Limnocylindrales bacterium]|nr:cyclic nucleotide-binding domain-containing protein [Candidatus Limnocylindrales bacterium]
MIDPRKSAAVAALREVAGNRSLRRVELSWTLGTAAEQAFLVVALVAAYQAAGVVGVTLVGLARTIPALAVALLVDVERGAGPAVMLGIANGVRALGAAGLAALAVAGLPQLAIVGAVAASAAAGVLARPAVNALRPALATSPSELVAANVAASTGEGAGTFAGPLLAGIGLATVGPGPTLVAIAVAFAIAMLAGMVPVSAAARPTARPHGVPILAGLRVLAARPSVAAVMAGLGAQIFVRGLLIVLMVVVAVDLLGLGDGAVGGLTAAMGAGGLIGATLSLGLAARQRLAPAYAVALTMWSLPLAAIGLVPETAIAVGALVVVGMANAALDIAAFTLFQRTLRGGQRGAVFGTLEVVVAIGLAAGSVLAPPLVDAVGITGALVVAGAILPLTALATWPLIRRIDDEATIPAADVAVLRAVPMLRLLPLAGLERLASDTRRRTYDPGDVVVREGDPGDTFHVIVHGTASVERQGRVVRELSGGDGFGEIALLRTSVRTATVRAREPLETLEIGREAFLGAVTGHEGAARSAHGTVDERLARDRTGGEVPAGE